MLVLIAIEKDIKATEASLILGVSTRTIETYISKLKDAQLIERHGSDKVGYWTIKKE